MGGIAWRRGARMVRGVKFLRAVSWTRGKDGLQKTKRILTVRQTSDRSLSNKGQRDTVRHARLGRRIARKRG